MRVIGNFNKVSDELLKTVPALEQGKTQWFKALWGKKEVDPESGIEEILYGKSQLPTRDRIKDPFTKKLVEIGIPLTIEDDKVISTAFFMPGMGEHVFPGVFGFTGGVIEDEDKYEFCMLSNFNAKNPNRDVSVTPMFEPMYQIDIHKESRKKTNKLRDALNIIDGMTPTEVTDFADSMNWTDESSNDILLSRIEDFAKKDPESFLKLQLNPSIKIKALIGRGFRFGIISHDITKNTVSWAKGSILIATFDKTTNKDITLQFSEWIQTHDKGKTVKISLEKQVKEAAKEDVAKQLQVEGVEEVE